MSQVAVVILKAGEDIEIHAESAPVYYEWEKVIFMHKNEYESNFRGMGQIGRAHV